ncbi:type 1 glycerol-3-phosphate oxidase [Aerococcus sp. UMB1112A]|uniref:type 1 glycerol-3-phosphate oxidase n=1 Tax=Aerococcus sp. UMB1112A TaxID=3050609 RepID=UPI00254D1895|nr:type 1 glycerol-3-phosphate oxidase [Aerococcus sp. UMB1112A]MDK8502214.1 type 1 glycerol-3-phosphate oxidase [Aerococcus sp. UMB1112A]
MKFSYQSRQQAIQKMQDRELDLLVIGGGITGAGVALQAAASGLETGLIEMQDFAEGTSSRSTKLVHGGIRYLKHFDVEVVSDTVKERAVVQQIAPHIPKPDPMILPVYDEEGATFNLFRLKVAMDLYDLLAGIQTSPYANKVLSKEEVLAEEPALKAEGLLGGGRYLDFNNSDIRLVIENIKRAQDDGALVASRVQAVGYTYNEAGEITGVRALDRLTDQEFEIKARVVINTTGPWSDKTRNLDRSDQEAIHQMRPTKGVHLVIDSAKLKVNHPVYFDSGHNDGRMIFVIPRENKTYFGTTDTDYQGDLKHPQVTQEDVDYLLAAVNGRFPDADISLEDVESSWAGLRPLLAGNSSSDYNGGDSGKLTDDSFDQLIQSVQAYLKEEQTREQVEGVVANLEGSLSEQQLKPSEVSRGSDLSIDDNGLITLAGGKITDYRKMAAGALEKIIGILADKFDRHFRAINSRTYPVSGGEINPDNIEREFEAYAQIGVSRGLTNEEAYEIAALYGSNAPQVFQLVDQIDKDDRLTLKENVMLAYAMAYEMTLTPVDYFLRRTNYLLFKRDEVDHMIAPVLDIMAAAYDWTAEEKQAQLDQLQATIEENDLAQLKAK